MPRIILSGCRPADRRERIACSDVCTSTDGMLIIREHGDAPRDAYRVRADRRTPAADDSRTRERPCAETPAVIGRDGTGTDGTRIPPAAVPVVRTASAEERSREIAAEDTGGDLLGGFRRMVDGNIRTKPAYADCWLIGSRDDLEEISSYDTSRGNVMIGTAADGETEYNLVPSEYMHPDSLNAVIGRTVSEVRESFRRGGGRMDRASVTSAARGVLMSYADTVEAVCGGDSYSLNTAVNGICDTVHRYTIGLGIFDTLLADPRLEDIYIDAPCDRNRIHVTMNGVAGMNSHIRCRTNLMVDRKEVMNLINILKRESGLPFCESNPVLETDMRGYDARATVVGFPMSPNGDAVAIRKRSVRPWTLTRLIANGTLDAATAGLLSFLVDNRATFLVCGARGAGKSSLLSALMFEFPLSQRILTIEDTIELPGEAMRRMGYKVQSMLIDDRMAGNELSRSEEALRVSLRMGESAIVLGEVRGAEARTLYQSMRTGRAGSSIMGTIHGDSARSVYERVVHDMGISPEAFMSTDVLVTLGTVRDRETGNQVRRVRELAATGDRPGEFADMADVEGLLASPLMRRVAATSQLSASEILGEIEARGLIRGFLAGKGGEEGGRYLGPEWIAMSNEHVARNRGQAPEAVLRSFKARFAERAGRRD